MNSTTKKFLLVLPFFFFVNLMIAQNDSLTIQYEVINYQSPKPIIISKARNLIMDSFITEDLYKVKKAFTYLTVEVEDKYYKPFYANEKWIIALWIGEYKLMLEEIIHYDSIYLNKSSLFLYPMKDLLYMKLLEATAEKKDLLFAEIDGSDLKLIDKEFLKLWVNNLLLSLRDEKLMDAEAVKDKLDRYLLHFPLSPYIKYIKEYIKKEYIKGKSSLGYHLNFGYGWYQEPLSQYFRDFADIELGLEMTMSKFYLSMFFSVGGSELKQQIPYPENDWLKGEYSENYRAGIRPGYVFELGKTTFVPFVSAGLTEILPADKDIRSNAIYQEFGTGLGFSTGGGLMLKIVISDTEYVNFYRMRYEKVKWLLNISTEYNYNFYPDERFSGGTIIFNVGLSFLFDGSYRNM